MNRVVKIAKLTVKNPQLAAYKAKITFRNKVTVKWDYAFGKGKAQPPACICIKLTNACNLRCKMCGQPREGHHEGEAKFAPIEFFRQKITFEDYQRLIDEVAAFRPNIYLWGGEPFMYKDILQLVRYVKSRGLTCQINTNGLYLTKRAEEIVDAGLDDLIISIDGPPEVHDQVRGLPGTFAQVEKGIQMIHEEKRKKGVKRPVIRIRGTISPENFEHVHSLVGIAKRLGADSLNFNWTWFTTKQTGTAHQRMMKKLFDTEAVSWVPYETDVIMDPEKLTKFDGIRQALLKLENNGADIPISMSPHIKPDQVEDYYTHITNTFGSDACFSVWVKSYILPNGDVTPCPDFPDYITGNITKESFMNIWNGERYKKWRLELKKRKLFPICYRCCDLFLSNVHFI
jgi:radical SAM protein with 4Fe4S-binding SPASM domain